MKTALTMLVLMLYCSIGQAQGTNPKKDDGICSEKSCMDQKFLYSFCDKNGNIITKCSNDPNNERGLKLLKRQVPIDYRYEWWSMNPEVTKGTDTIAFYEGDPLNIYKYPIFVGANMKQAIERAAHRWSSLCPAQGPDEEYEACQIIVRWSYPGENIGSRFATTDYHIDVSNCRLYCPGATIILNQHPAFTGRDEYDRPIKFIGTERQNYGHLPRFPYDYDYMDAYTTMLHEFGHWLGFSHAEEPDINGEHCGDANGIMKTIAENLEIQDLSWADQCMFLKAYCCQDSRNKNGEMSWDSTIPEFPPIDVTKMAVPSAAHEGFMVLPNPSRSGALTLRLMAQEECDPGSLRLLDATGRVMLEQRIENEKDRDITLNVRALPTGMYMVQVFCGDRAFSRKVVIE